MNKILLFSIFISILLFGVSVSGFIEDDEYIFEYNLNYAYFLVIGFIDNLTYYENQFFEIYGYNFTCKNVIILSLSNVDGFKIERKNNYENYSVAHIYFENFAEMDYKGFIGNKFICCFVLAKWDFN
ncbi:MAG: hypothetical protein KAJ21_04790 [Thermoplasmatales archaeon]|nr:hypothetical protein [Thermoplasmatales archaeon]